MPDYLEKKVSITLSYEAQATIESDMSLFLPGGKFATFVNIIIANYKDASTASIRLAVKREKERLESMLTNGHAPLTKTEKQVIDRLTLAYTQSLREQMHTYRSDSGTTKKIRINNQNFEDLGIGSQSEYYAEEDYRNVGTYIKTLLEDYARQDFSHREEIFFLDIIEALQVAIREQKLVRIGYTDRNNQVSSLLFRPYGILTNRMNVYHYFVGILKDSEAESDKLYSLRISRIRSVKCLQQSGHIPLPIQEGIKKQIREKNVQYIQGDQELYRIELTERGQKMYNSILYLRPSYTAKALSSRGRVVYDFDCTREQIQNYFFRFGKDALILSPDSLREEFAAAYRRASRAYKTP